MRKLTVLLLAGALLAIASVATAKDMAIVSCNDIGPHFAVNKVTLSFPAPAECVTGVNCGPCLDAVTDRVPVLLDLTIKGPIIQMIFTEEGVQLPSQADDDDD